MVNNYEIAYCKGYHFVKTATKLSEAACAELLAEVKSKKLFVADGFDYAKNAAIMHERLIELRKTQEYRQKIKEAAKISGEKRKKLYWETFISAHDIKIEDYKRDYLKYKNNCPNRHLELIYLIPYNQIRALNRYLGLSGGGSWHKNGKVSI